MNADGINASELTSVNYKISSGLVYNNNWFNFAPH